MVGAGGAGECFGVMKGKGVKGKEEYGTVGKKENALVGEEGKKEEE